MKTPIFFVSDNHFQKLSNISEKRRRAKFYSLLDHIENVQGTLVIGGDFFDFWFDYSGYVPFEYIDMFEKLKKLKRSGVDIYYVLGNHDYWDFGFFERNFSTKTISDEFNFTQDNQNFLVVHGDGILKDDYGYRIFRRIIRSKMCVYLFNLLPPSVGYYVAKKISKADKPKEYYKDNRIIKEKILSYAKEKWSDVDVILVGHYHQHGIIEKDDKKLIFLGDWLNKFLVTVYDGGVWKQIKWEK